MSLVEGQMSVVREIAHEIDRLRNEARLPTRRPLERVHIGSDDLLTKTALREPVLTEAIRGQCNVFDLRVWFGSAVSPNGLSVMMQDDEPLSHRDATGRFVVVLDPVETPRVRARLASSAIAKAVNAERKRRGWSVQDRGVATICYVPDGEKEWVEEQTLCEVRVGEVGDSWLERLVESSPVVHSPP